MIGYYDLIGLSKKKKFLLIIMWLLLILLMIYLITILYDRASYLLQDRIDLIKGMYDQVTSMIVIYMITWLTVDMTHPSERMIQSYIGVKKVWLYKRINSLLWIGIHMFISWIIRSLALLYCFDVVPETSDYIHLIHRALDLIMIAAIIHLISHTKYPSLSFIIPFLLSIHTLFFSDRFSWISYLIFPIFQQEILHYELAISYKLCYICLGYTIIYQKCFKKSIIR